MNRRDRRDWEKRIPVERASERRELERPIKSRRGAEQAAGDKSIQRGGFFGENALKRELLGLMSEHLGPEPYSKERQESQAEQAERVVGQELRRGRWTEATLDERSKGDREKLKFAVRLRNETLLYQWRQSNKKK